MYTGSELWMDKIDLDDQIGFQGQGPLFANEIEKIEEEYEEWEGESGEPDYEETYTDSDGDAGGKQSESQKTKENSESDKGSESETGDKSDTEDGTESQSESEDDS